MVAGLYNLRVKSPACMCQDLETCMRGTRTISVDSLESNIILSDAAPAPEMIPREASTVPEVDASSNPDSMCQHKDRSAVQGGSEVETSTNYRKKTRNGLRNATLRVERSRVGPI